MYGHSAQGQVDDSQKQCHDNDGPVVTLLWLLKCLVASVLCGWKGNAIEEEHEDTCNGNKAQKEDDVSFK